MAATDDLKLLVHDAALLTAARQRYQQGDAALQPAATALRAEAEQARGRGPFTIVNKPQTPPSGDKHDYMSLGTYWWPNPETPDGLPYVRRDGERNPEGEDFDLPALQAMNEAVGTLALAGFFFGERKYAERAVSLLRTFFLDEATRMNPNLNFAQAIPGRCEGRGIGIIDTATWARHLIDEMLLLRAGGALTDDDWQGLQTWFGDYLDWLRESPHGRDEAATQNNHGTAYDLQVAVFALFVGREELADELLGGVAARRIAPQVEPDGRQPLELERTRALSYATVNIELLFNLARLAAPRGIDLWRFRTADGRGLRAALDWLVPYWTQARPWTYEQITPFGYERAYNLLRQAAGVYEAPAYEQALAALPLPPESRAALRANLYYPPTA